MTDKPHIVLSEDQFRTLVSGGIVTAQLVTGAHVRIALSDIGWEMMIDAVLGAMIDQSRRKAHGDE